MKINKQGKLPDPLLWWVGKDISCSKCGANVQLEKEDASSVFAKEPMKSVGIPCPTKGCDAILTLSNDAWVEGDDDEEEKSRVRAVPPAPQTKAASASVPTPPKEAEEKPRTKSTLSPAEIDRAIGRIDHLSVKMSKRVAGHKPKTSAAPPSEKEPEEVKPKVKVEPEVSKPDEQAKDTGSDKKLKRLKDRNFERIPKGPEDYCTAYVLRMASEGYWRWHVCAEKIKEILWRKNLKQKLPKGVKKAIRHSERNVSVQTELLCTLVAAAKDTKDFSVPVCITYYLNKYRHGMSGALFTLYFFEKYAKGALVTEVTYEKDRGIYCKLNPSLQKWEYPHIMSAMCELARPIKDKSGEYTTLIEAMRASICYKVYASLVPPKDKDEARRRTRSGWRPMHAQMKECFDTCVEHYGIDIQR